MYHTSFQTSETPKTTCKSLKSSRKQYQQSEGYIQYSKKFKRLHTAVFQSLKVSLQLVENIESHMMILAHSLLGKFCSLINLKRQENTFYSNSAVCFPKCFKIKQERHENDILEVKNWESLLQTTKTIQFTSSS